MKITGSFIIRDRNKIVSRGENIIVNVGKQIFLNWLTHNLSKNNENSLIYQGKSLSSQSFLKNDQFQAFYSNGKTISKNQSLKYFWDTSTKTSIYDSNCVYIQANDYIKLSGIMFYFVPTINNDNYLYRYKIYTSQYSKDISDSQKSWTLQKIGMNTIKNSYDRSNQKLIRFQNADSVDGYLNKVKSIKIVFSKMSSSNFSVGLYGIGVLNKCPYLNVPCVIGLGTSDKTPEQNDTNLNSLYCKFFVNTQKSYIEYSDISGSSSSSSSYCQKFDVNFFDIQSQMLQTATAINLVYRARLNYQQFNNVQFKQIGLFFSQKQIDFANGTKNCDQLFSHGVFQNSWRKTSQQIIDIQYTLSFKI